MSLLAQIARRGLRYIFPGLLALQIPVSAVSQTMPLENWVRTKLEQEKPEQLTVIDARLWPYAPQPNTYVILAEVMKKPDSLKPEDTQYVVMLAESSSSVELANPKLIVYSAVDSFIHRGSIDVGPYQIRQQEYAFGIRWIDDALVGNKSGLAFGYVDLFRYQPSGLKQIFDEVIWGYTKYSEPEFRSCNTETVIVSEPPEQGEFFKLVRKYSRSYLGDSRMYPSVHSGETPLDSCPAFGKLQFPNTHTWDPAQSRYTDPESSLRQGDIVGKIGSPYR
jgi:hypothetical protein